MKPVTCKRCNTPNLYWTQRYNGKWCLEDQNAQKHTCNEDTLKDVKCKYCNANDLHWAEELNPETGQKKMRLTESYGLPHACDEQIAHRNAEKQKKKDEYAATKTRIEAQPDNSTCSACNGNGHKPGTSFAIGASTCDSCLGWGTFTRQAKRNILADVRSKIWPSMPKQYGHRRW